jgi:hypothetical protein
MEHHTMQHHAPMQQAARNIVASATLRWVTFLVGARCARCQADTTTATVTRRSVRGGLVTLRDACMQAVRGTPRVPSAGGAFAGTTGNRSIAVRHADAASSFRDAGACSCAACTERELAARRR